MSMSHALEAQLWTDRYKEQFLWGNQVFDTDQMQRVLQSFSEQTQGHAFRYLGDSQDFFHGHFLYADRAFDPTQEKLLPFAILYHTQEEASSHHKKDPGSQYDYLNRNTRSWVQFLDYEDEQAPIINAYSLMFDFFPLTQEFIRSLESTRSNYTVFSEQLDFRKFPKAYQKNIIASMQFNFNTCGSEEAERGRSLMWVNGGTVHVWDRAASADTCLQLQLLNTYRPQRSHDPSQEEATLRNNARPQFFEQDSLSSITQADR